MTELRISYQEALMAYHDLDLGSYVLPNGGNKLENHLKSAASILKIFGVTIQPEPSDKVNTVNPRLEVDFVLF